MKKHILKIILIISFLGFLSCEEDDVCIGEGTPHLTIVLKNMTDNENLSDSIYIETATESGDIVDLIVQAKTDSIQIPLGGFGEKTSYFKISRSKEENAITDDLTISYDTKEAYVSKACGFKIIYDNVDYSATNNDIVNIEPKTNQIKDESTTNLYIYYYN